MAHLGAEVLGALCPPAKRPFRRIGSVGMDGYDIYKVPPPKLAN